MLDAIYNAKILEYAGNIGLIGRLEKPDASAKKHSKLCGSSVEVDICATFQSGDWVVSEFAHDVKACALGQASSGMMAEHIVGLKFQEIKDLSSKVREMIQGNGLAPTGKFEIFKYLEPVREYKARHASTLLTFEAVLDCVSQIEATKRPVLAGEALNV